MSNALSSRRRFLATMPAAAWILAHDVLAQSSQPVDTAPSTNAARAAAARVRSVELLTAVPIGEMRRFYVKRMGLEPTRESANLLELRIGDSTLTFHACSPADYRGDAGRGGGEPMYHFAFNVAPMNFEAARRWQAARTPLIEPRGDAFDAALPGDVWHFRHWRARSVFFYDPAFNIVEIIARSEFGEFSEFGQRSGEGDFSPRDLECVSEIGLVMPSGTSEPTARLLHGRFGLNAYPPGTDAWWAMGDEHGLLLCLGRDGQLWGDHTPTPVRWGVFPVRVTIRSARAGRLSVPNLPYTIEAV